jgi:hypothetical protein
MLHISVIFRGSRVNTIEGQVYTRHGEIAKPQNDLREAAEKRPHWPIGGKQQGLSRRATSPLRERPITRKPG